MGWESFFKEQEDQGYYKKLMGFLDEEYENKNIYPPRQDLFSCFDLTPYDDVKAVILGQDPYHQPGQAHGLSFSVRRGVRIPPSLRNIYKELKSDLGIEPAGHGFLESWAMDGVFLLNAVMTVEHGRAGSHKKKGWELFSDNVISFLSRRKTPVVFILWGAWAQSKEKLITGDHLIIKSAHPSPLAGKSDFFGSRPFSRTNEFLVKNGMNKINWELPA